MFGRKPKQNIETNIIFRDWASPDSEKPISDTKISANGAKPIRSRPTSETEPNPVEFADDSAEKTLAEILKCYGRYAFDLNGIKAEKTQNKCYDLATSILGQEDRLDDIFNQRNQRDWEDVENYFSSHRSKEQRYVQTTLKDFRGVLWEFIRELGQTVVEDRNENSVVKSRLDLLKKSVQTSAPKDLIQDVLEVVQFVGKSIELREQKQRAQMRQFGKKLNTMRAELVDVRRKMALDPLTQLYNRTALNDRLERVGQLCGFSGEDACLFMVDADHFKQINDTYGHPVGDTVLKALADRCVRCFPRKTDFVARYGGEEFSIIVDGGSFEDCQDLGRRLLETVHSNPVVVNDQEIRLSVSIGMAILKAGETPDQWVERADKALRAAKQNGRDCIEVVR